MRRFELLCLKLLTVFCSFYYRKCILEIWGIYIKYLKSIIFVHEINLILITENRIVNENENLD